jgi:hypothetical protein
MDRHNKSSEMQTDETVKLNKLLDIINNEDIINSIATKCNSQYHDDRWCSVCESRLDGIDDFIQYIKNELNI